MKSTISLIRISLLLALGLAAVILFIGEESDVSEGAWLIHLIIDKALAIAAGCAFIRLYRRWSRTDPWLIAYNRWCDTAVSATDLDKA